MRIEKRWTVCLLMLLASAGTAQQEVVDEESGEVVREIGSDGVEDERLLDEEGRVIAVRHADGTTTRYFYDADGVLHVVEE